MLILYNLPSIEFSECFAWTCGEICLSESFLLAIVTALQTKSIFQIRNCTTGLIFEQGKPPAFMQDTRGKFLGQENHLLSCKIRESINNSYSAIRKWTVIRATTFPQFIEQFCSLIKMRLRITANFTSLMKESGWVPKALLIFQQIVGVEEYFLLCCPNRRISTLPSFIGFFRKVIQETGSKCGL